MARKYYGKIDKHTDWGGDESTGGLRVSGRSVQDFLRESLDGKAGLFHYDASNNRYMVFADEEARNLYMADPVANKHLLLANFDAPFNYEAHITLLSEQFVPLLAGSTGNYIEFTFDTLNKSGQSVGEDVVCTYTFQRGSVRKTLTQKYRRGTRVRLNIDKYIETGQNDITIGIVGQQTLAATTVGVTVQVVDLRLSDEFDIAAVVEETGAGARIEVPYSIGGYGTKRLEWYLDGVLLPYVASEDEVTETETSRIKYISVEGLTQGTHSLQFRAYTEINGERFYSRMLYREFMVYDHSNMDPLIAVATEFPLNAPVIGEGEELRLPGATQYMPYEIRVAVFNPSYAAKTPLSVYVDDALATTLEMRNGETTVYELTPTGYGEMTLRMTAGDIAREAVLVVSKSATTVEEITQGLFLSLSASGKSNSSADRAQWTYGGFHTVFSGFKWMPTCGWSDGQLVISGGASVDINCAPLGEDSTTTGRTLEFEFATRNVTDMEAVICDLRNPDGTGILITASEASLTSAGGARVSTRYKAEEQVRLAFVINRKSGVAEKGLVYLYVNGILSGAINYAQNDNFLSSTDIHIASSEEAEIALKQLRFYNTALTANQVLNNYILYRDTVEEFLEVYDRNNVFTEGTTEFSTEALSGQLPIMIVTGNIPALEATTDKNLQIDVDVEFINLQDPGRSFTIKDGAMRPQGTSSMSYPKKNFRLYTRKKDSTRLLDADGRDVTDRLYSFRAGSQPVDCWCLKADVAESSGAHNTGIARIWNNAMKNAQAGGDYVCRTEAQKSAIENGYAYDVRTAIDGFPILVFYRLTENDPLIIIGKYNFNNDKSTESVFGFRDIPGFDNSKVECWEFLDNGNHLGLFKDTVNWDSEWSNAFEARYPDGSTDTTALKRFATWISTVSNGRFGEEKHDHLDVWKVAAYYVYLMRFGAVDQTVKNAMITTEDGEHWYFINYDNDTICGLRNDGRLAYPPTIDRQTPDDSLVAGSYAYAGHESRLWNMLEGDTEFMRMVEEIDRALYSAGLSYEEVIKMLDEEQSGKWCERVYNQDAQYKYIGPFTDKGINNLYMLQGSRQSHRRWWLSERFALLDAKWVSGEYKANSFEMKVPGAPIGVEFGIKAAMRTLYGYGVNNEPKQYGIALDKGESHTFATLDELSIGDPLRIYAAPYLEEIDVSNLAPYLTQIAVGPVYSDRLGTKLRKLILGNGETENLSLVELSGISQAKALRELDVRGFKGMTSLDLRANELLERLDARGAGLTSVDLPKGAPIRALQLPASLQSLDLAGLSSLTDAGLSVQNNGSALRTVRISDCPELDTHSIVTDWLTYKAAADSDCTLEIDGVDWKNVEAGWLIRLGNLGSVALKGTIGVVLDDVAEIAEEQLTQLRDIFGKNCFMPGSELYLKVPAGIYIVGPTEVRGLQTAKYEVVVTSEVPGETKLSVESAAFSSYTFVDGVLTLGDYDNNSTLTLVAQFIPTEGMSVVKRMTVKYTPIKYPTSLTLEGVRDIMKRGTYEFRNTIGEHDEDAKFRVEWQLEGDGFTKGCVELGTTTESTASVIVNSLEETQFRLWCKLYKDSRTSSIATVARDVYLYVGDVILTTNSNSYIMSACYAQGWAANSRYMTAAEASAVTKIGDVFMNSRATSFNELVHFTNVSTNMDFSSSKITELTMPFTEGTNDMPLRSIQYAPYSTVHFPKLTRSEGRLYHSDFEYVAQSFDCPELSEAVPTYSTDCMFSSTVRSVNMPKLETAFRFGKVKTETFELLSLRKLVMTMQSYYSGYYAFDADDIVAAIEHVRLPLLEEVDCFPTGSNDLYFFRGGTGSSNLKTLELPMLSRTGENMKDSQLKILYGTFPVLESVDVRSLEYVSFQDLKAPLLTELNISSAKTLTGRMNCPLLEIDISPIEDISCQFDESMSITQVEDVVLPITKRLYYNSAGTTGILKNCKTLDAPILEEIYDQFGHPANVTSVNLPRLKTLNTALFNYCSSLKELNLPECAVSFSSASYLVGCTSLETLYLPKVTTFTAYKLPVLKKLMLNKERNLPYYSFNDSVRLPMLEYLEGCFSTLDARCLQESVNLKELRFWRSTPPSLSPWSESYADKIGSEVPEGVEKVIHVPVDATGYEESEFVKILMGNGFVLVKDLEADDESE